MSIDKIQLLRPIGSLKVLSAAKKNWALLFNVLLGIALKRRNSQTLDLQIHRSQERSELWAIYNPSLTEAEFVELVHRSNPAIFSFDSISWSDGDALYSVLSDWRHDDEDSFVVVIAKNDSPPPGLKPGTLVFSPISSQDLNEWRDLNQKEVSYETILGNRKVTPKITLQLSHTGPGKLFEPAWRCRFFLNDFSRPNHILFEPFTIKTKLSSGPGFSITIAFGYPHNESLMYVYDDVGRFYDIESRVSTFIKSGITKLFPTRIRRRIACYIEFDFSGSHIAGPLRELPSGLLDELKTSSNLIFEHLQEKIELQRFIKSCWKIAIEEEEKQLQIRKTRTRQTRKVWLLSGKEEIPLYREPTNEQDVVLLTSMLIQHNLFPIFEFLDYETLSGIDSIARVKLTDITATDDDAIVEFKFRLEDFLNDLHPLSLVDVIIAWDFNEKRFKKGMYKLSEPVGKKPWYRRLESEDGQMADVVILKYLDRLSIK